MSRLAQWLHNCHQVEFGQNPPATFFQKLPFESQLRSESCLMGYFRSSAKLVICQKWLTDRHPVKPAKK